MTPMRHQSDGMALARKHPRWGFFYDCGVGKTIMMLMVCDERPLRTLVVCPKSIIWDAWIDDAQHFPGLEVQEAWSKNREKRKAVFDNFDLDVTVTNFDTFRNHFEYILKKGRYRRLIVDESSVVKNPRSKITKCVIEMADRMDEVYCLSATPAANCDTEYWSQFRVIDKNVFGGLFYRFAHRYFFEQKKTYGDRTFTAGWKMKDTMADDFLARLASRSSSLTKEDAVDLPSQTNILRGIELSTDEYRHYKRMKKELKIELDGLERITNVNGKTMKLRQITGGNLYVDGEMNPVGDSKLKELGVVLDEIGNKKVVIWAEFRAEIDRIQELLESRGMACGVLDGRTKSSRDVVDAFQRHNQYDALVCQPQSAGHGITLTAANYAIYFSYSFSYEYHKQSRDRIHRKGQTLPCTYIYLYGRGTVDDNILDVIHEKKSQHEAMMDLLKQGKRNATQKSEGATG